MNTWKDIKKQSKCIRTSECLASIRFHVFNKKHFPTNEIKCFYFFETIINFGPFVRALNGESISWVGYRQKICFRFIPPHFFHKVKRNVSVLFVIKKKISSSPGSVLILFKISIMVEKKKYTLNTQNLLTQLTLKHWNWCRMCLLTQNIENP